MNAKDEFLRHIEARKVKCVEISAEETYEPSGPKYGKNALLPVGHTAEEMALFLESLNFEYHNGYGGQELFGTIWYEDGTWSERGEYDGSEWWEHVVLPEVPEYLLGGQS